MILLLCLSQQAITADTALRPARCFGPSAEVGLNLRAFCDRELARDRLQAPINQEAKPLPQQRAA